MANSVPSRFAGLKIDDDSSASAPKMANKAKTGNAKKSTTSAKRAKNSTSKIQLSKKKKAQKVAESKAQWELWKEKDEEILDGKFKSELEQAILLSKLDFEEKKVIQNQTIKKESEKINKFEEQLAKSIKQNKKKIVMSLEQFNEMLNEEEPKSNDSSEKEASGEMKPLDKDTEFFERVENDAENEYFKDQMIDKIKTRLEDQESTITRAQFLDALEKKDKEIMDLKQEVSTLKKTLLAVKSRNSKLCHILGQGEMKDKAEVLMEMERLRAVQAELTAEIATLHTHLEKERSKNTDQKQDKCYKKEKNTLRRAI